MLRIALFGRFSLNGGDGQSERFHSSKVSELFCYLLLHRDRPHSREMLASLLWGDHNTTTRSKKYLRNALWQLQGILDHQAGPAGVDFLLANPNWIELRSVSELRLDVAVFEAAYAAVKGVAGRDLRDEDARTLERATQLYAGPLLEDWYQDWCLCKRERLHHIFLVMLDKLTGFCESRGRYEEALMYGGRILQHDRARERTHQQIMRLHYLAGDRTGALRQYESCVAALRDELDVRPSRRTVMLYEHLRADLTHWLEAGPGENRASPVDEVMHGIEHIQERLAQIQQEVQRVVQVTEKTLGMLSSGSRGSHERTEREAGL